MVVSPSSPPQVRCRQIRTSDVEAVAELLARGFPVKPRKYWTTALERLAAHRAPEGCPTFGFLLEADGRVVGVQLLIFSERGGEVRCNVSSWYVEPDHRGHAAILASMASKLKHVTYVNTSAAEHTWPILQALGYRKYSQGQFAAVPVLKGGPALRVKTLSESEDIGDLPERELLQAHADAGCLVLVCDAAEGPAPFVFLRRPVAGLPFAAMQLIYARSTEDFAACAGPLGRRLLRHGAPLVICDAPAPVAGLPGLWFARRGPRYFKGPSEPRLNDLAFTEMVVFGP
jgi:hypothetical protein